MCGLPINWTKWPDILTWRRFCNQTKIELLKGFSIESSGWIGSSKCIWLWDSELLERTFSVKLPINGSFDVPSRKKIVVRLWHNFSVNVATKIKFRMLENCGKFLVTCWKQWIKALNCDTFNVHYLWSMKFTFTIHHFKRSINSKKLKLNNSLQSMTVKILKLSTFLFKFHVIYAWQNNRLQIISHQTSLKLMQLHCFPRINYWDFQEN